jgi:hypothetical protein
MESGAALTWGWTTTTTNFHATLGNEERIMTSTSTAARNEIDLALDGLLDELFGDDGSSLVETKLTPSERQSDEVVSVPRTEADASSKASSLSAAPRRPRRWLWAVALIAWAGAFGFALHKGLQPEVTTKPIAEFQVGMVVPGDKIHGDNDLTYGDHVDPKTWRHLRVEGTKEDGRSWDADLLLPPEWLAAQGSKLGGQVYVSVPECGIDGEATVLRIGPCPEIPDLDGRVVTSVFRHASTELLDLHLTGLAEPISVTANHPFGSEDRQDFVRADSLEAGEQLLQFDGSTIEVDLIILRSGRHAVYNLQVNVDHVFHVTDSGVLAHNAVPGPCKGMAARVAAVMARRAPKITGNAELGGLIRGIAGKSTSAAEKVRLLTEGAGKIKGINFNRLADIPGAEAVFKGAPRALDGKSPVLVVLKDGRIFRGFDDALIPDPSGATSGLRLLLNRLGELK